MGFITAIGFAVSVYAVIGLFFAVVVIGHEILVHGFDRDLLVVAAMLVLTWPLVLSLILKLDSGS